jgi:UDP-N-acetyl-2-amino-2-deoxyglucuronate dehydrogenase
MNADETPKAFHLRSSAFYLSEAKVRMARIRFGMIGAGSISRSHLSALAAREDAEVTCLADANETAARDRAGQYGVPTVVTDYRELMARDDVDAVVVGIPTRFHPDAAIQALESGKHVLCEKPLARTLEECDAITAAARASGRVFQVAFVRRFDREWGTVRELVQAGAIGRPVQWRRVAVGGPPQPPYGGWYTQKAFSDGPLTESGSHDFDFARYTFGDAKAVTASVWRLGRHGDIDDMGTVIVDFHSGDQMVCQWAWSLPVGSSATIGGLDVLGPDGVIRQPRREEEEGVVVVSKANREEERHPFPAKRTGDVWYAGQMGNFIAAIRSETEPRATAEDGRKAQEIYLAAVESSRTGRRVDLPL